MAIWIDTSKLATADRTMELPFNLLLVLEEQMFHDKIITVLVLKASAVEHKSQIFMN